MQVRQRLAPILEPGCMRATAALQEPIVTLIAKETVPPTLCIEEAGVVLELEFPDPDSLLRFRNRIAAARWHEKEALA